MRIESCFLLGTLCSSYGFRGEFLLSLKVGNLECCISVLDSCFILIDDNLVPYFSLSKRVHGKFIRIQFEGVSNEILAKRLLGKEVYLPLERFPKVEDNTNLHHRYIGYLVFEKNKCLGEVKEILTLKQPLICLGTGSGREIFIPFVKEFIEKIIKKKGIIYMTLPEGLLEMNGR